MKGSGGARAGAGKKLGSLHTHTEALMAAKATDIKRRCGSPDPVVSAAVKSSAADILSNIDETSVWTSLVNSDNEKIKLEAIKYLTDRRDGKASQAILMSGNPAENTPIRHVVVDL